MPQVKYPVSFFRAKEIIDTILYRLHQLKYQLEASEQNFPQLSDLTTRPQSDPFALTVINRQRSICYDNLARTRAVLDLVMSHIQTIKYKTEIIAEASLTHLPDD